MPRAELLDPAEVAIVSSSPELLADLGEYHRCLVTSMMGILRPEGEGRDAKVFKKGGGELTISMQRSIILFFLFSLASRPCGSGDCKSRPFTHSALLIKGSSVEGLCNDAADCWVNGYSDRFAIPPK